MASQCSIFLDTYDLSLLIEFSLKCCIYSIKHLVFYPSFVMSTSKYRELIGHFFSKIHIHLISE